MFEVSQKVKFLIFIKTVEQTNFALIRAKIVEYINIIHIASMKFYFNSFLHDTTVYICDQIVHVKLGYPHSFNLRWVLKVSHIYEGYSNLEVISCLRVFLAYVKRPIVIIFLVVVVYFYIITVGHSQSVYEGIVAHCEEYNADYD